MAICGFCRIEFSSSALVRRHQSQNPACKTKLEASLGTRVGNLTSRRRRRAERAGAAGEGASEVDDAPPANLPTVADLAAILDSIPLENEPQDGPEIEGADQDQDASAPPPFWYKTLGKKVAAGATYGGGKTVFEIINDEEILKGGMVLGPFRDDDEWQLAKWLIKNVGHTATDEFLKLSIITNRADPSYGNKTDFFEKVDSLPGGAKWHCKHLDTKGDLPDLEKDPTGATMRREHNELWWRDPVECVQELMGNPAFRDAMRYAPEKLYADQAATNEVINEMWTANWWWEIQKRLPPGATIAPLILSSDKTMLSNFRGDNSAWPVYLTIGNIGKETRRKVSSHATVLIGYLPIPKFDCFDKSTRSLAKYRLFHQCMAVIMQSIIEAGKSGRPMVCADSLIRNVWPIFAAYVADYPEQCLISCCKENRCPICTVRPDERGDHQEHPLRDMRETLFFMQRQQSGEKDTVFEDAGMRAVYPPFWANLPHSDIFQSFTPDLLHQLHKGVFKDHLVSWCIEIIGKLEIDSRFRAMPDHHGVRHFKHGISSVSQWTGTEHKEMEKVFLGLIAAGAHPQMVIAVRGPQKPLNIPKVHSLDHYEHLIRLFGSADGFNTESPERLHIDYAKNAYRASNRKDYIEQMTLWLERQEGVARFGAYLDWAHPETPPAAVVIPASTPVPSNQMTDSLPPTDSLIISRTFSIAKQPSTRAVAATHIISPDGHNASLFIPALATFLTQSHCSYTPRTFDTFGTWKRISFQLPRIPEVGERHSTNLVRATSPAPADLTKRKAPGEPAHLDFALIRTGEENPFTAGTALTGLRVAQVKAIFKLPSHYPVKQDVPLAYIEWFTPLRTPDTLDGYYHLTRSTRRHGPYAEIITADRIVRNAMLIPQNASVASGPALPLAHASSVADVMHEHASGCADDPGIQRPETKGRKKRWLARHWQ
ncbi:hypothetical protein B0H17DRAFT_1158261 [Mycena rosella]|uniref:Uncharacterized protein n=1 Tax=Mycena rosella TaxID=1033263 RepID=A0AAD7DSY8_MYCRO|nr:hypothetical protein B0H17DRAFT_1158261 [Mycena rosella]